MNATLHPGLCSVLRAVSRLPETLTLSVVPTKSPSPVLVKTTSSQPPAMQIVTSTQSSECSVQMGNPLMTLRVLTKLQHLWYLSSQLELSRFWQPGCASIAIGQAVSDIVSDLCNVWDVGTPASTGAGKVGSTSTGKTAASSGSAASLTTGNANASTCAMNTPAATNMAPSSSSTSLALTTSTTSSLNGKPADEILNAKLLILGTSIKEK
ncbi:hypothetical protein CPB84DRAFT_1743320 [Gymnopilus junonius]|uniref:Uncharacterized protein n=1 Tax=Gymnopilus junonius TaxID=109634 RepID=A0A9P5NY69_GYMJU|nr:hypothetical protein CPB84DRAFT_1743320 [Gymnopilus junonius]